MRTWFVVVGLAGCDGASSSTGRELLLQLKGGGQVRPGPFPAESGGPATVTVSGAHAKVATGEMFERLSGVAEADARVAFIGLGLDPDGCSPTSSAEDGAWIVPAGPPDSTTGGKPVISVGFGLAYDTPPGPAQLLLAAADEHGAIGSRACFDFEVLAFDPSNPDPTNPLDLGKRPELVVSLRWPGRADLDLHLIDPSGSEAWSDVPNTHKPIAGTPESPFAYLDGAILDHDGNQDCARDPMPSESFIYHHGHLPPPGDYLVRVDARAMCGDQVAPWEVTVYQGETLLGASRGLSAIEDVQYEQHGYGAGITALTFTVPQTP